MRQVVQLFFFALLLGSGTLNAQVNKTTNDSKTPKATLVKNVTNDLGIQWDVMKFDYGNIPQNVPAEATFTLTNTGAEPLLITNVKGSCGCTATAHSDDPVAPGESTTITATYNAKKKGAFTKFVKVTTNRDEAPIKLQIKGNVEVAE